MLFIIYSLMLTLLSLPWPLLVVAIFACWLAVCALLFKVLEHMTNPSIFGDMLAILAGVKDIIMFVPNIVIVVVRSLSRQIKREPDEIERLGQARREYELERQTEALTADQKLAVIGANITGGDDVLIYGE